jgi:hypothetical protein
MHIRLNLIDSESLQPPNPGMKNCRRKALFAEMVMWHTVLTKNVRSVCSSSFEQIQAYPIPNTGNFAIIFGGNRWMKNLKDGSSVA